MAKGKNNSKQRSLYTNPLYQGAAALVATGILVIFCYFVVDKPVAFAVYFHRINNSIVLQCLTYIASVIEVVAIVALIAVIIRFFCAKLSLWDRLLLIAANSVIVTDFFVDVIKMVFGRYWPMTWVNNNPSLITDDAYGFHWFHGGAAYGAFPSGHTAVTLAAMTILWLALPRWRWLAILLSALQVISLIGMDYHFVSDTIAGGVLGWLVAYYSWLWCQNRVKNEIS